MATGSGCREASSSEDERWGTWTPAKVSADAAAGAARADEGGTKADDDRWSSEERWGNWTPAQVSADAAAGAARADEGGTKADDDRWSSEERWGNWTPAQVSADAAAGAARADEGGTAADFVPPPAAAAPKRQVAAPKRQAGWCKERRRQRFALLAASLKSHDTELADEDRRSEMAGARAADILSARKALRSSRISAAGATAAPDAAAGAAVDPDSHDECAVGVSGFRAGGSADAPVLGHDPALATRGEAAPGRWRWGGGRWHYCAPALGPPTGGHGCPQSADPKRTALNRKKKARKAASLQRYFERFEAMDKDAAKKDAADRCYKRFYYEHLQQLRGACPPSTASEASGSASL